MLLVKIFARKTIEPRMLSNEGLTHRFEFTLILSVHVEFFDRDFLFLLVVYVVSEANLAEAPSNGVSIPILQVLQVYKQFGWQSWRIS
jgi:hypothetical protein